MRQEGAEQIHARKTSKSLSVWQAHRPTAQPIAKAYKQRAKYKTTKKKNLSNHGFHPKFLIPEKASDAEIHIQITVKTYKEEKL